MSISDKGYYPHQAIIDAYGDGGFRFADMSHRGSLFCLPTGMHAWKVATPGELSLEGLQPILDLAEQLDVVFLGLGEDIAPLIPTIRQAFKDKGIIVEAVSTGSAISAYNMLFAEQRAVAAALIAVERPSRVRP